MFKKLVLSVLMIGMFGMGCVQLATAAAGKPLARTVLFYETAAKVNVVGWRDVDCDGNVLEWGVITTYRTIQAFPCN